MVLKITEEIRNAVKEHPGQPIKLQDEQTRKVYLLIDESAMPAFWEEYIRQEVWKGLAAIDRGEVEDWDVESIKAEGREVFKQHGSALL